MLDFAIVGIAAMMLVAVSFRASEHFGDQEKLPMQWSFGGKVTWSAPRFFALSFTPLVSTLVLGGMAALAVFGTPEHRQGDVGSVALLAVSAAFVAGHALHLFLIGRTLRKSGR